MNCSLKYFLSNFKIRFQGWKNKEITNWKGLIFQIIKMVFKLWKFIIKNKFDKLNNNR